MIRNDLTAGLIHLQEYKDAILNNTEFKSDNKNAFVVDKKLIKGSGDYNLFVDRYRVNENVKQSNWEMEYLKDVSEINPENINPSDVYKETEFMYLDIASVENGSGKYHLNNSIKGREAPSRARRKIKQNHILLSTVRPNLKLLHFFKTIIIM